MELVPKEELESYMQGAPKSVADLRARKVLFFLVQCYMISIQFTHYTLIYYYLLPVIPLI